MNSFTSHNGTTELDEQLAITAIAGDANAFEVIVTLYERRVFGFLGRMGFDQATAADLAQDTFVRVWRHRALFDARRGPLTGWLFGIARNVALTELRRAGRRPTNQADDDALDRLSTSDDASKSAERTQQRDQLHTALQLLPDADRTAIALSYVEGLTAVEAAALLNCRPDAYRARLSRARKRLAELLENTL